MTSLATKQDRDSLGIDSYERAIVYSALLLTKSLKSPESPTPFAVNPYRTALRLEIAGGTIRIGAFIPFDRDSAINNGYNVAKAALSVGFFDPTLLAISPPTLQNECPIPVEPVWVDTLERYLLWACQQLSSTTATATITPLEDTSLDTVNPSIQVQATVTYDQIVYNCTGNLIRAVGTGQSCLGCGSVYQLEGSGTGSGSGEAGNE